MADLEPSAPQLGHTVTIPGDGSVVIALSGELDIGTTDELELAVAGAIGAVTTRLIVDAEALRFADSTAIALWVGWSQRVPRVEIHKPSPMIRRVIESMGLAPILNPS